MAYQVLTGRLAFQKVDPEDPMVAIGEEVIVEKFGKVPDWVLPFTINALTNSGLIGPSLEREDGPIVLEQIPPQPRTPDQPLILPSDPNGTPLPPGLGVDVVVPDEAGTAPVADTTTTEPAVKPSASDSKAEWELYATTPQVGMTQAEAESMTKRDLIAEVNRRESAQQ